jgi:hypothetical protein
MGAGTLLIVGVWDPTFPPARAWGTASDSSSEIASVTNLLPEEMCRRNHVRTGHSEAVSFFVIAEARSSV